MRVLKFEWNMTDRDEAIYRLALDVLKAHDLHISQDSQALTLN